MWIIQKKIIVRGENGRGRGSRSDLFPAPLYISRLIFVFTSVDDDGLAQARADRSPGIFQSPRGIYRRRKKKNQSRKKVSRRERTLFTHPEGISLVDFRLTIVVRPNDATSLPCERVFSRANRGMFVFRCFDLRVASFTCAFCYTSLPRFLVSLAVSNVVYEQARVTVSIPVLVDAFVGQYKVKQYGLSGCYNYSQLPAKIEGNYGRRIIILPEFFGSRRRHAYWRFNSLAKVILIF